MRKLVLSAALLAGAAALPPVEAAADPVADFYKGRTIRYILGAGAGGGYDLYSRTLAQHMAARIPGKPTVLIVNMPGGGGVKASNYAYNAAAKDGTAMLMPFWTHPMFQLIRPKGIKFDMARMGWIGNMAELNSVIVTLTSAAKTIDDARAKQIIFAASGKGSETYIYPQLLNSMLGTKIKMVLGYSGTRTMTVAMERGEAQGRGGSWQSWSAIRPNWYKEGKTTVLAQAGLRRLDSLKNVPLIEELVSKPEDKKLVRFLSAPAAMARITGFPPGVPRARLDALRTAFVATMKDPKFLKDAAARKMDLNLMPGAEVQRNIEELMTTPKPILMRAKQVLGY